MTMRDGKPCRKCGTSSWNKHGQCAACLREYNRRWQRENKDKVAAKARRWVIENPEKNAAKFHRYRTRKTQAGGSYTVGEWRALCKHQDGRCLACGKKKKLTADHVVPVSRGGSSDIDNIQGLCKSCNASKGDKTTDYRTEPGVVRWIQKKLFG